MNTQKKEKALKKENIEEFLRDLNSAFGVFMEDFDPRNIRKEWEREWVRP